jgi:hypothetical protein
MRRAYEASYGDERIHHLLGAVNGEVVDISTLCQLASTALRLSSRLSIERVPRDVAPTLSELLTGDGA